MNWLRRRRTPKIAVEFARQVVITGTRFWINGKPFPFFMTEEGPTIHYSASGLGLPVLMVPILVGESIHIDASEGIN